MAPVSKVPVLVSKSSSYISSNNQFKEGTRVLVVDDDNISLTVAKAYLHKCGYHVTTCTRGTEALSMLRENRQAYDILLLDVHMPKMNGLQLLKIIGLEMDIPVVMISSDSSHDTIEEGLKNGACDYIIKPFDLNQMQNLWTHITRRRIAAEKKRKRDDSDNDSKHDCTDQENNTKKKQRVQWTIGLHRKFTEAINILGIDKAGPKGILELMDAPELSRRQVASHLQQFRDYLKKIAGVRVTNQIPKDVLNTLEAQMLPQPFLHNHTNPSVNIQEPGIGFQVGTRSIFMNQNAATINPMMRQENDHILTNKGYGSVLSPTKMLTIQGLGSCVTTNQLSSARVPDLGNNHNSVIALAAGEGTSANMNIAAGPSPECSFSDEDEMLQEDFLVRLFNSSSDDAFL